MSSTAYPKPWFDRLTMSGHLSLVFRWNDSLLKHGGPGSLPPLPLGFALLGEGFGALLGVFGEEQGVVHLVGQG